MLPGHDGVKTTVEALYHIRKANQDFALLRALLRFSPDGSRRNGLAPNDGTKL